MPTGKTRIIPLNETAQSITERRERKRAEYVSNSNKGRKIDQRSLLQTLQTAHFKLDLKVDAHKLPHALDGKLAMNEIDIYTVKELLGHADFESPQINAHISPKHLKSAIEKLE